MFHNKSIWLGQLMHRFDCKHHTTHTHMLLVLKALFHSFAPSFPAAPPPFPPTVLTNSLSALNLANSLLPPTGSGGLGRGGGGGGLAPTGSSLLLPMSGDMNSLKLLSSLAFLHSNLRPEDSFKQVLNQVNLGSPRASGGLEALLQDPTAAAAGAAGSGGGTPSAAAAAAAEANGGPFAAAAAAGGGGGDGAAVRSRLNQESH